MYRPHITELSELLSALQVDGQSEEVIALLTRRAREGIRRHLCSDLHIELAGLLLGHAYSDGQSRHVVLVEQSAPALGLHSTPAHVIFGSETWDSLKKHIRRFPELNIVGWYHSHPGLGVFLSTTDLRTQSAFFAEQWQLALVVDPVRSEWGFFHGSAGGRCRLIDVDGRWPKLRRVSSSK